MELIKSFVCLRVKKRERREIAFYSYNSLRFLSINCFVVFQPTTTGILEIRSASADIPLLSLTPAEAPSSKSTRVASALLCSAAT